MGGGCHPAREIGFEGALVDVASAGFAGFVEDAVGEEGVGGVDDAVYAVFPDCAAVCLGLVSWMLEKEVGKKRT